MSIYQKVLRSNQASIQLTGARHSSHRPVYSVGPPSYRPVTFRQSIPWARLLNISRLFCLLLLLRKVLCFWLENELTISPSSSTTDPVDWYLELLIEPSLDNDGLLFAADMVWFVINVGRKRSDCNNYTQTQRMNAMQPEMRRLWRVNNPLSKRREIEISK